MYIPNYPISLNIVPSIIHISPSAKKPVFTRWWLIQRPTAGECTETKKLKFSVWNETDATNLFYPMLSDHCGKRDRKTVRARGTDVCFPNVFAWHDNPITHMNSQWLPNSQELHKTKMSQIPAQMELSSRCPINNQGISESSWLWMGVCVSNFLQGCESPETTHASVDGAVPMHIQAVLNTLRRFQKWAHEISRRK